MTKLLQASSRRSSRPGSLARLLALCAPLAAGAPSASADDWIVVPEIYEDTEAPGANSFPLFSNVLSYRYQQIYSASEFHGLEAPFQIDAIAFRPDRDGGVFAKLISRVQINLSTTLSTPADPSIVFEENVGNDDTEVRPLFALAVSSNVLGPPDGPKVFDVVIPFVEPFVYDPAEGNLLVDFRVAGEGNPLVPIPPTMDRPAPLETETGRVLCPDETCDVDSAEGAFGGSGLVTAFQVPEPGVAGELVASLALLALARRRRSTRVPHIAAVESRSARSIASAVACVPRTPTLR